MFNLLVSVGIAFLFIIFWGKVKTKMAYAKMEKALECIRNEDYTKAIKHFEDIGNELKYDSNYWFNLGVAFVGVGSRTDAKAALEKAVDLGSEDAERLMEIVSKQ